MIKPAGWVESGNHLTDSWCLPGVEYVRGCLDEYLKFFIVVRIWFLGR
jgi:hypothetical protein